MSGRPHGRPQSWPSRRPKKIQRLSKPHEHILVYAGMSDNMLKDMTAHDITLNGTILHYMISYDVIWQRLTPRPQRVCLDRKAFGAVLLLSAGMYVEEKITKSHCNDVCTACVQLPSFWPGPYLRPCPF